MNSRKSSIFLVMLVTLLLTGCSRANDGEVTSQPSDVIEQSISAGDVFLASNLKIRSEITDTGGTPQKTYVIELYVDRNGNGQGLIGIGDIVLDVYAVNDKLYVVVDDDVVVLLTDITSRLIFANTAIEGSNDLGILGFTLDQNSMPISYSARSGSLVIHTEYAQSSNEFTPVSVVSTTDKNFTDAVKYILDYYANSAVTDMESVDKDQVLDFYIKSNYGVQIGASIFSVGDTCNPSTYFYGYTPEGIVVSHAYRLDERLDFTHVSYILDTGRTVFTLLGNYVQAIQTTADFSFLGIKRGTSSEELGKILGYNLRGDDLANWKALDENLVLVEVNNDVYHCTLGNLNVEFRCKSRALSSIYIEQALDFTKVE